MSVKDEGDHPAERARTLTRRRLLGGAAGAVAAGGLGALGAPLLGQPVAGATTLPAGQLPAGEPGAAQLAGQSAAPSSSAALTTVKSPPQVMFQSRPDLLPPTLQATVVQAGPPYGLLLLTPSAVPTARGFNVSTQIAEGLGQPGVMIADVYGQLVWFKPTTQLATNLQVQSYDGKPVLTYWEGRESGGMGFGTGYILDDTYTPVATVKAGNGVQADLHELQLTPQNTALITGYVPRAADLSAIGGPKTGSVWDSVVQEIDVKTGKVLLDWRSLDHVPVTMTEAALTTGDFDYFHVNSASLYGEDELLISSRNTWALYRINRRTGALIARINGKASNYKIGPGANFYWQHHSRLQPGGIVSLFDDGAAPAHEPRSRALELLVDDAHQTVTLRKAFTHPANLLTPYEGSMQPLPDGGAFVGWGGQPYWSQFAADGQLVIDGRFPTNGQSYRAFRANWVATPAVPPDVALVKDTLEQTEVYVSWNGATQVASWQVRCGNAASSLEVIATVPKAGFETAIATRPTGKLLAVAALDARGKQIGISKTMAV